MALPPLTADQRADALLRAAAARRERAAIKQRLKHSQGSIAEVIAVTKAYSSSVGAGVFPSCIPGAAGEELRRRGAERERPPAVLGYIDRLLRQF